MSKFSGRCSFFSNVKFQRGNWWFWRCENFPKRNKRPPLSGGENKNTQIHVSSNLHYPVKQAILQKNRISSNWHSCHPQTLYFCIIWTGTLQLFECLMRNLYRISTRNENCQIFLLKNSQVQKALDVKACNALLLKAPAYWSRNGVPPSMLMTTRCFRSNGEAIPWTVRKIQEFLSKWGDSMDTRYNSYKWR